MYKIFLKFPEALKPAFPRLKEKLEDPDPGMTTYEPLIVVFLMVFTTGQAFSRRPLMWFVSWPERTRKTICH